LHALLKLEDGTQLRCPLPVLADLRLCKGDELTQTDLEALQQRSLLWTIRHTALRLLARRAYSREELQRALLRRFPAEVAAVAAVVEQLQQEGYLNDAAYAEAFVQQRLARRAFSPAALVAELRRRGIGDELARQAVSRLLPEAATLEQARRAAERKLRHLHGKPRAQQWRSLASYLARHGFPASVIRTVLQECFPEQVEELDGE